MKSAIDAARESMGYVGGERPAGAITAQEYSDRYGVAYVTASEQLRKMARRGLMVATKIRMNGKIIACYSPAEKK